MRTLTWSFLLGVVAVLALPAISWGQQTVAEEDQWMGMEAHVGNLTGHSNSDRVKYDYRRYCVGCHGDLGDGNGENAMWFIPPEFPKPRDFTLGIFKCRSTPTGTLPTDDDLFKTIARGLITSNMPPWNTFTDQQRADLVAYVKHFSPRFQKEKPGTPIQIPPEPPITAERVKAGYDVYNRVQCWKCHGIDGRGNGPSASTLTDDQNRPIAPYDFHDETRFKCGTSDEDLYKIFMTGLDGTPMPSWSDNIKPDEAWDLVFYLRSLQPMHSTEKNLAKQLGLWPVKPAPPAAGQ
jgi:mono/diheme cytochrome c family protein